MRINYTALLAIVASIFAGATFAPLFAQQTATRPLPEPIFGSTTETIATLANSGYILRGFTFKGDYALQKPDGGPIFVCSDVRCIVTIMPKPKTN